MHNYTEDFTTLPTKKCEKCNCEEILYRIDGMDLCQKCADKYLRSLFNEMTFDDKASALYVDIYYY